MLADHIFEFWLKTDDWPRDTSSYIFLARVLDLMGRAMFEQDWKGTSDICSKLPPSLPISMRRADRSAKNRAYDMLARYRSDRGLTPRHGVTPPRELTEEEWSAAQDVVREMQEQERPRVNRFKAVEQALVSGAETGKLLTAYRQINGGQFTDMPAWWWNTEKISNRLCRCQINPANPFSNGFAGTGFCLIFVAQDSLKAYLAELKAKPDRQPDASLAASIHDPELYYDLVSVPGKKQQAVFTAIKTVWPDGRVPRLLSIAEIENQISPVVKRMGDPGGASTDNIRRALGLKK